MCAACVAQGAAYLVPVYAAMKTRTWHRRRHGETVADTASEPIRPVADDPRDEMAEV